MFIFNILIFSESSLRVESPSRCRFHSPWLVSSSVGIGWWVNHIPRATFGRWKPLWFLSNKCDQCKYVSEQKSYLKMHMKRTTFGRWNPLLQIDPTFSLTWGQKALVVRIALFDTQLFKKINNFFERIKQHYFEWMIFWIWITLPRKKWIFCHQKMNELLNEWKKCVIHRKNEYNVKKKDVKFDKRSDRVWKTDEYVK